MSAAERFPEISLVDLLLQEQESLTAVERFAQRHGEAHGPLQERYYRNLIPATPPGPGEQYAFRVDLDACTGCKACVTACHNLNGLDAEETWREVGLLVGEVGGQPVQQTVTTACHHCEDPGCLSGCPVRAYEKDPVTGIVRHLDDQCIGCQYCTLKCPYDVPKYDAGRGIVRKCDMCSDRLAEGEAPACVQGCPNDAISIEKVRVGTVPAALLPAQTGTVPDSGATRPTTRYVRGAGASDERAAGPGSLRPVDLAHARPGAAHHPLSVMLVLSQLAVGSFAAAALLAAGGAAGSGLATGLGAAAALLGLGVANLHLGRPQYAFRAILGLPTSWMSREIVALGAFVALAVATAGSAALPGLLPRLDAALPSGLQGVRAALPAATTLAGLSAVLCSVMIYADTPRAAWRFRRSAPLFFGTVLCLGFAAGVLAAAAAGAAPLACTLALGWAAASGAKLWLESRLFEARDEREAPSLERTRALLAGVLQPALRTRRALGFGAGVALPVFLAAVALAGAPPPLLTTAAVLTLALATAAEWLERNLFFRSCAPVGMPGSG